MPSINCKIELKLNSTKYCVLSANGNDNVNDNDNANDIIFTIKDKIICPSCNFLSKRQEKTIKT